MKSDKAAISLLVAFVVFSSLGIFVYRQRTQEHHHSIMNKGSVVDVGEIIQAIKRERNVLREQGVDDGDGLLFRNTPTYMKLSKSSAVDQLIEVDKAILQERVRGR